MTDNEFIKAVECWAEYTKRSELILKYKSEAIKDFAERLKKKAIRLNLELSIQAVFLEDIDNLVKEMVGDNK